MSEEFSALRRWLQNTIYGLRIGNSATYCKNKHLYRYKCRRFFSLGDQPSVFSLLRIRREGTGQAEAGSRNPDGAEGWGSPGLRLCPAVATLPPAGAGPPCRAWQGHDGPLCSPRSPQAAWRLGWVRESRGTVQAGHIKGWFHSCLCVRAGISPAACSVSARGWPPPGSLPAKLQRSRGIFDFILHKAS